MGITRWFLRRKWKDIILSFLDAVREIIKDYKRVEDKTPLLDATKEPLSPHPYPPYKQHKDEGSFKNPTDIMSKGFRK